jgi:hypothetical protein
MPAKKQTGRSAGGRVAPGQIVVGSGVKMVPLAELRAHPRNPRKHDRAELDELKRSMLANGFTAPCIRQVSTGFVVAGAGRLMVAQELAAEGKLDDLEFTPGVKLNGCLPVVDKRMDDRHALAYMIADNQLTVRGTWDFPEVKSILVEDLCLGPDVSEFDLPTGFEMPQLQSLVDWEGKGDPLAQRAKGKAGLTDDDGETTAKCPSCGYEWCKTERSE